MAGSAGRYGTDLEQRLEGQFGRQVVRIGDGDREVRPAFRAGIMVKQGTPEAVVARLHQALVETLQDAQVVSGLEATGAEVAKPSSVADSQRFLQTETGKFRAMAKRSSLQPQ
ncbi:Tripartite tricarboxylate transporter family receptor [compost metagenome]